MVYQNEDELYCVGAVAVADESDEHDTTSDASDWVRQYTDWMESGIRTHGPGPGERR